MEITVRQLKQEASQKLLGGHDYKELLISNGIVDKQAIHIQQTLEKKNTITMSVRQAKKVIKALQRAVDRSERYKQTPEL